MDAKTQPELPAHQNFSSIHDVNERLKLLSQLLKVKSQETITGTDNHSATHSPKDRLLEDISTELNRIAEIGERIAEKRRYRQFKVKLDLSVAQLACLLRMFTQADLITSCNISSLIRSVALACETRRSERLSPRSLRVKFYEIEDGTRQSVREILANLLKASEACP